MKKNVLFILLSILIMSCNSDNNNSEIANIESTLIAKGNLLGNGDEGIVEQNIVISDQNTWIDLIAQMNSVNIESDNFSETNVDFSEYKVIAVFDELKGNGGHSLELNITSNSENIIVNITNVLPEGNVITIMTQPYYIIKIPTSDLQIIFQ